MLWLHSKINRVMHRVILNRALRELTKGNLFQDDDWWAISAGDCCRQGKQVSVCIFLLLRRAASHRT